MIGLCNGGIWVEDKGVGTNKSVKKGRPGSQGELQLCCWACDFLSYGAFALWRGTATIRGTARQAPKEEAVNIELRPIAGRMGFWE